jgi:hypothetical protein
VPKLVDTTIRLLSQEPLAGRLPTAEILRVAEILDRAGFACREISGGGVFDATVRRRVESPWERIRAIKTRVSTPLGIALRGRFLVGSRPVSGDIVGRFVACAAENGIEVFRLHDPLNDVSNLREAGAAITSAGGAFRVEGTAGQPAAAVLAGGSYTLASITAVVLGGASIFGGRGSFIGAFMGALLIQAIITSTAFLRLGQAWQFWLPGILVLVAAGVYSRARGGRGAALAGAGS